uniref:Small EDRK-rich factor-like N-terminal domain-containing protein n=1 Tax=Erpetoichthys calabaricus TaxID=27687 RepID=A0A8C4SU95_ERPCA
MDGWKLPGGNQRELARQKNIKKNQENLKGKRKDDNLSPAQRKQRAPKRSALCKPSGSSEPKRQRKTLTIQEKVKLMMIIIMLLISLARHPCIMCIQSVF